MTPSPTAHVVPDVTVDRLHALPAILLLAPPGFGKTRMLQAWMRFHRFYKVQVVEGKVHLDEGAWTDRQTVGTHEVTEHLAELGDSRWVRVFDLPGEVVHSTGMDESELKAELLRKQLTRALGTSVVTAVLVLVRPPAPHHDSTGGKGFVLDPAAFPMTTEGELPDMQGVGIFLKRTEERLAQLVLRHQGGEVPKIAAIAGFVDLVDLGESAERTRAVDELRELIEPFQRSLFVPADRRPPWYMQMELIAAWLAPFLRFRALREAGRRYADRDQRYPALTAWSRKHLPDLSRAVHASWPDAVILPQCSTATAPHLHAVPAAWPTVSLRWAVDAAVGPPVGWFGALWAVGRTLSGPAAVLLVLLAGWMFIPRAIGGDWAMPAAKVVAPSPATSPSASQAKAVPKLDPKIPSKVPSKAPPKPTAPRPPSVTAPQPSKSAVQAMTSKIFYRKHPELVGQPLEPGHEWTEEWNQIQRCDAVVDAMFDAAHPELGGRGIQSGETDLAREWRQLRGTVAGCR